MTKHLYRIATGLQESLLGAAMLHGEEWPKHTPRVQLDAWATLFAWHRTGESFHRMTEADEAEALDRPLPSDLPLATAPTRSEALAIQLPDRSDWIVIARHQDNPTVIPVQADVAFGLPGPLLTYCSPGSASTSASLGAGFINLADQPTLAAINLLPGTVTSEQTGQSLPLHEPDRITDDYRLTLAISTLYRR